MTVRNRRGPYPRQMSLKMRRRRRGQDLYGRLDVAVAVLVMVLIVGSFGDESIGVFGSQTSRQRAQTLWE